jgi:hypothetical protein
MDSDTGTNIWTVDNATIRTEIGQRNVLRQSALLPLLDEQQEFDHACRVIRSKRWHAFCESKQANYERFREEVMAGRRAPSGYIGAWGLNLEVHKRFKAFLLAECADEIAIMMDIAPDYLAITRWAVEATSNWPPA